MCITRDIEDSWVNTKLENMKFKQCILEIVDQWSTRIPTPAP